MTEPPIIFNQSLDVARPRRIDSPYSTEPVYDHDNPEWVPVGFPVSVQPAESSEDDLQRLSLIHI